MPLQPAPRRFSSSSPAQWDPRPTLRLLTIAVAVILSVSVMALGAARGFHDWRDKVRCLDCHVTLPLQVRDPGKLRFYPSIHETCRSCHPRAHATARSRSNHPLIAKTDLVFPRDMPKDDAGRMNCMTCHYYHPANTIPSNHLLLRRPAGRNFCLYCHQELPPSGGKDPSPSN